MKFLATITGTIATLLLVLFSGRLVSESWLFFTPSSFQVQGAVLVFSIALLSFAFYRHWLSSLLMLASIGLGLHGYLLLNAFSQPPAQNPNAATTVRLLSFNIMGNNIANGRRIADYIINSGADVVFIQESAPIGPFTAAIKATYPFRLGCGAETVTCDQSLWSKRPFIRAEVHTASPIYRDRLMLATIDFDGKQINFANVHLTKPYFDNFHEIELGKIAGMLKPYQEALVLAGDFNASILPADVQKFMQKMGLRTADSEPNTWPVRALPVGMAIDHVFVTDPLHIKTLKRVPDPLGSNHYGLVAEIVWEDGSVSSQ